MYGLDQGRFTVAAGACGVVRAMLERSVEYARERETFGQPIGKYQFVQDMIAEMVLGYETSKLLVMQAAWLKNEGKRNTRETSLAKWHATESAFSRGASGDPGARRVRVLGGVRDRAVLPQRSGADHLRGHDAGAQDDAGGARARLSRAERPRRRGLAGRRRGRRPSPPAAEPSDRQRREASRPTGSTRYREPVSSTTLRGPRRALNRPAQRGHAACARSRTACERARAGRPSECSSRLRRSKRLAASSCRPSAAARRPRECERTPTPTPPVRLH